MLLFRRALLVILLLPIARSAGGDGNAGHHKTLKSKADPELKPSPGDASPSKPIVSASKPKEPKPKEAKSKEAKSKEPKEKPLKDPTEKSSVLPVDASGSFAAVSGSGVVASPPPPPTLAPASSNAGSSGSSVGMSMLCFTLLLGVGAYMNKAELVKFVDSLSHWGQQTGSFVVLVCVQSCALLLFKLCQTSGSYSFSPASSVALTEACKLALAVTLHSRQVSAGANQLFEGLTPKIVLHYFGLAMLYTINNQLTFYCFQIIDPGTFALGKSVAPYLVALFLRLSGDRLNQLQWVCILLQCICLAVTQYNSCKDTTALSLHAYLILALATGITATSSVWNQKVVKGFQVPVNLQNTLLYVFGFSIAVASYLVIPDPKGRGFFTGYNLLAAVLVLFQAFHGLAVTLVYKYADAIVKNFANATVSTY